jgi:RES domain-containing protein
MITIHIPDDISMTRLNILNLPIDWNKFPPPSTTQNIGDKFISENLYCVIQIPSSITEGDFNLLINPHHADFKRIKILDIKKFVFDQRLFK